MIPTLDKNILLLPVTDGGVTQYFNMPGFSGYNSNKGKHNGLDIGYCDKPFCNILACQDGKVVKIEKNGSSIGNAVTLQHEYEDGTHRWTSYIHLKDTPTLKVGQTVKQGDVVGIRGGSPYVNGKQKYGTHLHLYVTSVNDKPFTWKTLLNTVVDPYPLLYLSKKVKYDWLNSSLKNKPYIEDKQPKVIDPVPRDEYADQLTEKASNLRVRTIPSLKGTVIGYLKPNVYYNYYDTTSADGYTWRKIADDQWCAQTDTMTVFPASSKVESLENEVAELKQKVEELTAKADKLTQINDGLLTRIAKIRNLTMED